MGIAVNGITAIKQPEPDNRPNTRIGGGNDRRIMTHGEKEVQQVPNVNDASLFVTW
jgi:hypothetical protein